MRYALAMSFLVRRLVTCKMEPCSMSSGIGVQISDSLSVKQKLVCKVLKMHVVELTFLTPKAGNGAS